MTELLNAENFKIHEVTRSEMEAWVHQEFHGTHPESLVKATFPEHVMIAICSDHHKSRDGAFSISYDHWTNKWYFKHPGYCREVEASGDSYLEAASNYLAAIEKENAHYRFHALEEAANERLPEDLSVEIREHSISLYRYGEGENGLKMIQGADIEGKSLEDVVEVINGMIAEHSDLV